MASLSPAAPAPPCEHSAVMVRELDAQLQKGDNPGAWTCVVLPDAAELFGTRGLVKIRGAIDGEPFVGALMAQGDGSHRLPVKAKLRKAIGKEAGDTVHVRIDEGSASGPDVGDQARAARARAAWRTRWSRSATFVA